MVIFKQVKQVRIYNKYIVLTTTKTTGYRLVDASSKIEDARLVADMFKARIKGEGGSVIIAEILEKFDVELF